MALTIPGVLKQATRAAVSKMEAGSLQPGRGSNPHVHVPKREGVEGHEI